MDKRSDACVVFDLDGTLIPRDDALMKQVNTRAMPAASYGDRMRLRDTYLIPAIEGRLPPELEPRWIIEEIENYIRHRLDAAAWKRALGHVRLRPGVPEAIRQAHEMRLPTAIVSFGVADFVEHVLDAYGLYGPIDRVYAARLVHDGNDTIVGYHDHTVVHPGNKGDWSRAFADEFGVPHDRILSVGDSIGDRNLGYLRELRVGIAETEAQAEEIRPHMGQVVVTQDFMPVWELLLLVGGLVKP